MVFLSVPSFYFFCIEKKSNNNNRTSMNSWIAHVKQYASNNKVSYKTAMKQAGASFTKKVKAVKEKQTKKMDM